MAVIQERVEQFLLAVHLETMEIHKTCVTLTQKKLV